MRRDPRLHGLSSDHHHALVLARSLSRRLAQGPADRELIERVRGRFEAELRPHFEIEQEVLLPALSAAGFGAQCDRIWREHAQLRDQLEAAGHGDGEALGNFATLLTAHVRFEERELFPACEAALADEVLDSVLARAPKRTRW